MLRNGPSARRSWGQVFRFLMLVYPPWCWGVGETVELLLTPQSGQEHSPQPGESGTDEVQGLLPLFAPAWMGNVRMRADR